MNEVAIVQDGPGSDPQGVALPNPVSTDFSRDDDDQNSRAEGKPAATAGKASPKKPLSVRQSVEAAAKKAEQKPAEKTADKGVAEKPAPAAPKAEAAATPANRDVTGKFIGKEGEKAEATEPAANAAASKPANPAIAEAPARYSADAKAAWKDTPDPVKHETYRAIKNLEQGIAEHQANYAPFKPFHELAKQVGVDPARALQEYVSLDRQLGENFPAAMARICQNKRVDIRAFAADVLGLNAQARAALRIGGPQPQAQPLSPETLQLRHEVEALKQRVHQQDSTAHQQQQGAVAREIDEFKATNPPMFDELSPQIAEHITNSGLSLKDAYAKAFSDFQDMARRAGLIAPAKATPGADDPEAQRQRGLKSIAGAPGAGSSPDNRKPASSIKEAIRRAQAQIA